MGAGGVAGAEGYPLVGALVTPPVPAQTRGAARRAHKPPARVSRAGVRGIPPGTGTGHASGCVPRSEPSVIGASALSLRGPESGQPRLPRRDVTAGGSVSGIFGSKRSIFLTEPLPEGDPP
ncbi:hypothetical protein GCM10020220_081970 [Nonomuraea rubra]